VSAGSFWKLVCKVMNAVPGVKKPGAGRFFYPVRGYGQISEAYAEDATVHGADVRLGWRMTAIDPPRDASTPWRVTATHDGRATTFEADYLWSTLPITVLARSMAPGVPSEVVEASKNISYRSMILIYVHLPVDRFTEYDAHYFPGISTRITRMSEPKNYSALGRPLGTTVLCAELPCNVADAVWAMSDGELGQLVADDLAGCDIPLPAKPMSVFSRRLAQAYPIYLNGYEAPFGVLDHWAGAQPRLLSYGRQGLFAHDNTHHALYMAYGAVECLSAGRFDDAKWSEYRKVFATHVVED